MKAGKRKLEAVNNFLVAITAAESYFANGGKLFHKAARKKHMKKLDELIEACDIMYTEAEQDMDVFKAFLTSGADFKNNQGNIDTEAAARAIDEEMDRWEKE